MPSTPRDDAGARPRHRWVVEILLAVVVVHSVILTLWLAPSSPLRDAAGDRRLSTYVDPYFQQSRDVLGVGSEQVDESFSIRAVVTPADGGEPSTTSWIDLTKLDNRADRHEVVTDRVHLIARRLATNLNLAMFGLTDEQRRYVRGLTVNDVPSIVGVALTDMSDNADAIRFFQAYDQMATQFASLYAQARWDDVTQVEFRVGRRTVPPRADRDETSIDDVPFRQFVFGQRTVFRGSLEARETFDSYVKK